MLKSKFNSIFIKLIKKSIAFTDLMELSAIFFNLYKNYHELKLMKFEAKYIKIAIPKILYILDNVCNCGILFSKMEKAIYLVKLVEHRFCMHEHLT